MRAVRAALIGLAALVGAAQPGASAQTAGTFDWQALNLGSLEAVPSGVSQTSGVITTTFSWSVATDGGMTPITVGGTLRDYVMYYQNTYGGVTNGGIVAIDNDQFDLDDRIETEFAFSAPVTDLQLTIGDVDEVADAFDDFVVITYDTGDGAGFRNVVTNVGGVRGFATQDTGQPNPPAIASVPGTAVGLDDETFGPGFEGLASDSTTQGQIVLDFGPTEVVALRLVYFTSNDEPAVGDDTSTQVISISDLSFVSAGASADLSLAKSVDDPSPSLNDTVTFTLTASNAGPAAATATILDDLPPGLTYLGHAGTGAYDPSTGLWSPGQIAANASASLTIDARVDTTDPVTNVAEVFASDAGDPDSDPNNRASAPGEDDTARAVIGAVASSGTAPSLACASPPTLDWDTNAWASGSAMSKSYTVSATPMSVAVGGDVGGLVNGTPETNTDFTGGFAAEEGLHLFANHVQRTDAVSVTMTFGSAGTGVSEVQFAVYDVDTSLPGSDQFEDLLIVEGSLDGAPVTPLYTTSTANASNGFRVLGTAGSGATSNAGNVVVTFQNAVDTVVVTYGNGEGAGANRTQRNQAITIADVSFCPALPAVLSGQKRLVAGSDYSLPGAAVEYEIEVANTGGGAADAGSLFIADELPDEVELFLGDIAGAGSGPVVFTELSTGLSWDGDNVRVATTQPTSFADCQAPAGAGYDPTARFLCIRPGGAMRAGDPDPVFTVRFRARIK